jgi:toxin ParE1/3/4
MSVVRFSPAAVADLNGIWEFTAKEWGAGQADRYTDDIRHLCDSLARGDTSGRAVDQRAGYRKHPVGRHVVFFRKTDAGIDVIRILHQAMDVGRHV